MKSRSIALCVFASWAFALPQSSPLARADQRVREIEVRVEDSYEPSTIEAREGERVRLVFYRPKKGGCASEVVIPSLGIRKDLPVGERVRIELPPLRPGELPFHCGMEMLRGKIVVRPSSPGG